MEKDLSREFVRIPSFEIKWERLGFSDEDLRQLEAILLQNPKIGPVMKGTGRARKMRYAFENRGKSGSARVIYVDFEVYEKIYLLDVYAKKDQDNLSKEDRNDLKLLVDYIEVALDREEAEKHEKI